MKITKIKKPLKLQNKGNLEIAFIGCGTAFGEVLYNNNFILIKGNTHLLVDFGMTGPWALRTTAGLDLSDIQNIFITHSHADHVGGLECLALYNRYVTQAIHKKSKLNMIITKDYQKILWERSLRGGMEWNETAINGETLKFEDYFNPIRPKLITKKPRLKLQIHFEGIELEIFGTNHIPENAKTQMEAFTSYGILIDNKVLYTGDTKFDMDLLDTYGSKAEVIFHDSSFFPNPVHASIPQLKKLPKSMKKKIVLMHYGDDWQNQQTEGFLGLVKQGYKYSF